MLADLAIKFPRVTLVILVCIVAWGFQSLDAVPRREDPPLTWRLANVVTRMPGTSAARMESLVTDLLERHVERVDEVEHIYSVSRPGISLLQIELRDEVTDADPVWQKVQSHLDLAQAELPANALGPELDDEIMGTATLMIAVTSKTAGYRTLKDFAQQLEDEFRFLPETASTTLFGTQQETVTVELNPAQLAVYKLSIPEVVSQLRSRNTRAPAGRLDIRGKQLVLEASGELTRVDDLPEVVMRASEHQPTIKLGDIAEIRRGYIDPPDPLVRVNGVPSVVVTVRAVGNCRIDDFGRTAHQITNRISATLPPDIQCNIVHDESQYTVNRLSDLSRTLMLSILFVFLTVALFMGWRAGAVVTAAIPLTGLTVMICFNVSQIVTLQQMSVMGIIMAFGLLVDDVIVVTEEIERKLRESESTSSGPETVDREAIRLAAVRPAQELSMPLLVTTLTTIAAFLPIYLLEGGTGEFVRSIPISVSLCLLVAFALSITFVPWLCWCFLPNRKPTRLLDVAPRDRNWSQLSRGVGSAYQRLLDLALYRPKLALIVIVTILIGVASVGLRLRRDFFSPVQRDEFVIDVYAPQGSSITETERLVQRVEACLADDPDVTTVSAFVGRNAPLVFYNLTSQETFAKHFAQVIVRVRRWQDTKRCIRRVRSALKRRVPRARCVVQILQHGAPSVAPYEIRIRGHSIPTLRELARRTAAIMQRTDGLRDVRDNYGAPSIKWVVDLYDDVAGPLQITHQQIAEEFQARIDGWQAGTIVEGDEQLAILCRLPTSLRNDVDKLRNFHIVPAPHARAIPVSAVAQLRPEPTTHSIYRRDGVRTISVLAFPELGLTAAQVSSRFFPQLEQLRKQFPDGYSMTIGGENEQRQAAELALLKRTGFTAFLMVLFLVLEFHSLRLAALIMAVVPLCASGAMLGLWLTGWPLNFMAIMGILMLAGIAVNDSVILIDSYERRLESGESLRETIVKGTRERTRHVMITTTTTVAGFLPLALSPSLLWPPLAIAIIGGLLLATVLTLLALPAAYMVLRSK